MAELKGFVQYRFRSDENDAEILLRGDADWAVSYTHLTLPTNREV